MNNAKMIEILQDLADASKGYNWAKPTGPQQMALQNALRYASYALEELKAESEPKPEVPEWPKAWIHDRPYLPDATKRFKLSIDDGHEASSVVTYYADWPQAYLAAKAKQVHDKNILTMTNVI